MRKQTTMILTRKGETVSTVEVYKTRKKIRSYAEALDRLVSEAKSLGLHRRDVSQSVIAAALDRTPAGATPNN